MFHIHWYNKVGIAEIFKNVELRGKDYRYIDFSCRCGKKKGKFFPNV